MLLGAICGQFIELAPYCYPQSSPLTSLIRPLGASTLLLYSTILRFTNEPSLHTTRIDTPCKDSSSAEPILSYTCQSIRRIRAYYLHIRHRITSPPSIPRQKASRVRALAIYIAIEGRIFVFLRVACFC